MTEQTSRQLTITRIFDAPRELVFRAWTRPEMIAQWWGPNGVTNPVSEVDGRVGGRLYIVMLAGEDLGPLAGQRWPMQGEFLEFSEPSRLVFKNQAVTEDGKILIDGLTTVTFADAPGGKTKMTLLVTATGRAPEAPQMLQGMHEGWSQSINKLEVFLRKAATR